MRGRPFTSQGACVFVWKKTVWEVNSTIYSEYKRVPCSVMKIMMAQQPCALCALVFVNTVCAWVCSLIHCMHMCACDSDGSHLNVTSVSFVTHRARQIALTNGCQTWSLCVHTVQCKCFCMCILMLYGCLSTYVCDNVFASKLSWQQHQSPHGSGTGNHIKAQLHSGVRLSDTSKLNISNSNSIQTDIYIHTKVRACKFAIYNAQDSIWGCKSKLKSYSLSCICVKNILKMYMSRFEHKFATLLHSLKFFLRLLKTIVA